MPSVEWNRYWDRYDWSEHGEEWSGQARFCGQPYEAWKQALLETFAGAADLADARVLEIAPGHGRWSAYLIEHAASVVLVDLNSSCIEFCRERFAEEARVEYHVNDGRTLPMVADGSIDLAWSYDSFVHMEPETTRDYLREFARVLKPGGRAVIHHPGRKHSSLALGWLRRLGGPGRAFYKAISMSGDTAGGRDGDRGNVSREMIASMAVEAGLEVVEQTDHWGDQGQYDCRRFRDVISVLARPA